MIDDQTEIATILNRIEDQVEQDWDPSRKNSVLNMIIAETKGFPRSKYFSMLHDLLIEQAGCPRSITAWETTPGLTKDEVRFVVRSAAYRALYYGPIVKRTKIMTRSEILEIFKRARVTLAKGWCHKHVLRADGSRTIYSDPRAVRFSIVSALLKAMASEPMAMYTSVLYHLEKPIGGQSIYIWQEQANRTVDDVLALMDRVIANLEGGAAPATADVATPLPVKVVAPTPVKPVKPWEELEVGKTICLPGDLRDEVFKHQMMKDKFFLTKPMDGQTVIKRMR